MGIEKFNEKLANHIGETLHYTEEQTNVIAYGLFTLLQTILSIGLVMIIGLILGIMTESLIVSFSIVFLRKCSGGVHATSPERCLIIGTLISILGGLLGYWFGFITTIPILICIGIVLFSWGFYVIYKKAPVTSINKPIKSAHRQRKLKQRSLIMLVIYFIIVSILLYAYSFISNPNFIIYSICLMVGMGWQVFTLTNLGHNFAECIDHVLIYISNTIKILKCKRGNQL
ncbi:accessory gene regulator ArgB-like protein [Niameybacter massiliensis]|uniref:accessory gene regulator ArgB-like protein n=1 Tax=Niameybacter massiliensis TaxID=1658108 RepID=UPI0006B5BCE4|nr:accessory gene regulator B family protein [Niameybacter massiliensis]